jgi:uncharacterized protein YcfJ
MLSRWVIATTVLSTLAANAAVASHGRNGSAEYVYARVVAVEPIVRHVTVERPRRECWQEVVYGPAHPYRIAGPTIAGGVIGGAIGRQFGSGSGRDAMTLIGTLAGAAVANQRAVRNQAYRATETRAVEVDRCELVTERYTEERIDGYRVTYQYQGRRYTMHTHEHPGERVRLQVSVRPARF